MATIMTSVKQVDSDGSCVFADETRTCAPPRVCVEGITCTASLRADVYNLVYVIGLHRCTASADVNQDGELKNLLHIVTSKPLSAV